MTKPSYEERLYSHPAMKALHDLTPGGSEFAGDPKYCADYIRKREHSQHQTIIAKFKENKELKEGLARVRGLLQRGVKLVGALVGHDYWNPEYLDAEEAAPEWIARSSEPEPAEAHAATEIATGPNEIRVCGKHIVSFAGNEPCGICGGSAETGGEKAAPKIDPQFLGEITEAAIKDAQYFREKSEGLVDYNEADPEDCAACAIVEDNPCPFHLGFAAGAKWAYANFRRSSQNQTVSSGVEGAHEGTTADKSGSREPEKLYNAQLSEWDQEIPRDNRFNGWVEPALAESSLSSPPQTSDLSAPCSPAPFSTQPDTTKENI